MATPDAPEGRRGATLRAGSPGAHQRRRLGAVATRPGVLGPRWNPCRPPGLPCHRPRRRAPRPARAPAPPPRRAGARTGTHVVAGSASPGPSGPITLRWTEGWWSCRHPESSRGLWHPLCSSAPSLTPPSLLPSLDPFFRVNCVSRQKTTSPGCDCKAPRCWYWLHCQLTLTPNNT